MTATESHQSRPLVLLRRVPGPSAIHDLWAGTKLITALAISVLLASYPGWGPIALTAALLITTARLAHIPRGALPSVPRWLWVIPLLAGATAALAGGSPFVDVGPITVG
ncbi:MAG TPA: CbiQ family ECF transporter T component, partial [Pseudonocardia sp.]|nr:CbiQ family ECF transporter T component [Pseudonocardia sp.]